MATRVVMPKLTDTMEEGVVVTWKKHEGDAVDSGDVLAEIETDKAVMDLEAFGSGTLRKLLAGEGETVKAGSLIAVIADPDEDIESALTEGTSASEKAAPEPKPARKKAEPAKEPSDAAPAETPEAEGQQSESRKSEVQQTGSKKAEGPTSGQKPDAQRPDARKLDVQKPEATKVDGQKSEESRLKVSPRAKTIAEERGIDLSTIKGSGPEGRIIERDLPEQKPEETERKPTAKTAETDRPLSQMRKAIARTMVQSKAPVPHFYLTTEIAMDEAERLRQQWKHVRRAHPSLTDFIIKAAAVALTRHSEINVSYVDDKIRRHGTIDIGVAVGLDDGLITPVLRDCGGKTLEQISAEAHRLIDRARNRQLKPEEYVGATFSISNLGMFEVENFIAVLVPPEAAAIAVGMVRDAPVAEAGTVKLGRRMKVTLSCDHRALDGVQGAKFLSEFKRILEHPLELIISPDPLQATFSPATSPPQPQTRRDAPHPEDEESQ